MIRLKFTHTPLFRTEQRLLDILQEKFPIEITDESPDYVIGSVFTPFEQLRYKNSVKILFTGENVTPDFNVYDYAIGFDHIQFEDRYLRLPLYCLYPEFDLIEKFNPANLDLSQLAQRKFCSFVVSNGNGADPIRTEFFHELCKYKKVDSAGRYLNNMGGGYLEDKIKFIANYKFNIAFENSAISGYTTEKVMEPMKVNSIPIYWGNPSVDKDFNTKSIICLQDFSSIKECIEYIIELDNNDNLYTSKLCEPWLKADSNYIDYKERLWNFFENIFSKPLDKARYISDYGYQPYYREELTKYRHMGKYIDKAYKIKNIIKRIKK